MLNVFEAFKEFTFSISIYMSIGKFRIPITYKQRTTEQEQRTSNCGELDLNKVLNRWIQVNYINPLLCPLSVSDCPSSGRGVLCNLIFGLTLKGVLLLFTLLCARKPNFENISVLGNHIKFS